MVRVERGKTQARKARIALCELVTRGGFRVERGGGLVWVHDLGMVGGEATADAEGWKKRDSGSNARVSNANGTVDGSLAATEIVATVGQPRIGEEVVKANVAKGGLARRANNRARSRDVEMNAPSSRARVGTVAY